MDGFVPADSGKFPRCGGGGGLSCALMYSIAGIRSQASEAMKKRWSPGRASVTVMCITTQGRNQSHAG